MKKRFHMTCRVTVSAYTYVMAESLDKAMEIAESRDVGLGFIGSGNESDDMWVIEEADGLPTDIEGEAE